MMNWLYYMHCYECNNIYVDTDTNKCEKCGSYDVEVMETEELED